MEVGLQSVSNGQFNATKATLTHGLQKLRAYNYCALLKANGHNDWYLPARDELSVMFNNRSAIGGLDKKSGTPYWSSSEYTSFFAWSQEFSDGFQNGSLKNRPLHVRCVRQPGS